METELLTSTGAARVMGCSADRIRQMARQKLLPYIEAEGGKVRLFLRRHIEEAVKRRAAKVGRGK